MNEEEMTRDELLDLLELERKRNKMLKESGANIFTSSPEKHIRIKLDSHDIKALLMGKVVSVKDVRGNVAQIIASDDGVDVYQAACDEALEKVRNSIS